MHDVTRSESFRNSKSSGNFLRQSKHGFDQVTILKGYKISPVIRSKILLKKPKPKLVFTPRAIKMFTNYFMDDRKCFEDVLRMREFHELLSGLIHEFIKWFNMG